MLAYAYLFGAIATELLGTSLLKATDGFSRFIPSVICIVAYIVSFAMMAQTVKTIPVGVTYALWSAFGTAAIVAIGVVFLHETINATTVGGLALLITGVVVLNLGGAH
ncbi:MAG: small multidrug resistance protein [Pseudonocardiales bacterium]|nr:small multidrug resistance protein [Pseudonocardiales bacterium]